MKRLLETFAVFILAISLLATCGTGGSSSTGTGTSTSSGSGTGTGTQTTCPPGTTGLFPNCVAIPPAPAWVIATAGYGQATISWIPVSGADSYNVYYRVAAGVTIANGTKVTGATSGQAITGLANGQTYYFIVTAVNAGGESVASMEVSASPGLAVTTIAGSAGISGSTDGTGTGARFYYPVGITTDGTSLYVTDNCSIRKIVIATGVTTTLAGSQGTSGSYDGPGVGALFNLPQGITTDGTNIYVADTNNNTIRKVVMDTGAVTTLAGSAGISGSTNGTGAAARFNGPYGIATDADGTNLYVTDTGNNTIRKVVIATGVVSTLAGSPGTSGSSDGTGSVARFKGPNGLTSDGTSLYVTDTGNTTIRKVVITTGVTSTLAGSVATSGSSDGTGTAALFNTPYGITNDGTNVYMVDTYNHTIRKIVIATGVVSTVAGKAGTSGSSDGTGAAALFKAPYGITTYGTNLYVADSGNYTIRKIQ